MSLFASYRYQMADHRNPILLFYLVMIGLSCISAATIATVGTVDNVFAVNLYGGPEMATLVFLFVMGLCTFKETFFLFLQNGVSRKTLFAGKLLTFASIALILSAADTLLRLIIRGLMELAGSSANVLTFYASVYGRNDASGPVPLQVKAFFFEFFLALFVMALGYFITVLFYRLNAKGKILVGAGVPILLLIALPLLDAYVPFPLPYATILHTIFNAASRTAPRLMASALLGFVLFSTLAWLLMRKAVLKR